MGFWATVKTIAPRYQGRLLNCCPRPIDRGQQFKMSSLIPRGNSFDCCPKTHEIIVLLPIALYNHTFFKKTKTRTEVSLLFIWKWIVNCDIKITNLNTRAWSLASNFHQSYWYYSHIDTLNFTISREQISLLVYKLKFHLWVIPRNNKPIWGFGVKLRL